MRFAVRTVFLTAIGALCLFAAEPIRSIADIKEHYSYINRHLNEFTVHEREIPDISSEGAVITRYEDALGMLQMAKLNIFSEMGKVEKSYYFHNNRLFFLYQVDYRHNAPMYAASYLDPKKTETTRSRFYFIHNKMVRWIDEGSKSISSENPDFAKKEQQILAFVSRYILTPSKKDDHDNAPYHLKKGERLLYGLTCKNGKELGLVLGNNNTYLQYRYGKRGAVELTYPENRRNSFRHFTYSHYLRGGAGNSGLDLQYLRFENHHTLYVIYDEHIQDDNSRNYGIEIIKKGKILARIKCDKHKGALSDAEDLPINKDEKTEFSAE